MTTLMFLSLEPWAMARILTPLRASDEKNLPATPTLPGIPSPTAARTARSVWRLTVDIAPEESSSDEVQSMMTACG